ncbi:MAG: N-acetylglutamate synthase [Gemmatimonadales bacterium]|nr:MAG: N-acetylglutamate synthase [Gemmatimonadales bacterium]
MLAPFPRTILVTEGAVREAGGVERALPSDAPAIAALVRPHARAGLMLPRSEADILERIDTFLIIRDARGIVACGALRPLSDALAEVSTLAVRKGAGGSGLGGRVLDALLDRARLGEVPELCVLTRTPGFFRNRGFRTVPRSRFPEKEAADCRDCPLRDACPETAMVLHP